MYQILSDINDVKATQPSLERLLTLFPDTDWCVFLLEPRDLGKIQITDLTRPNVMIALTDAIVAQDYDFKHDYWHGASGGVIIQKIQQILDHNPNHRFVFLCHEADLLTQMLGRGNATFMKWLCWYQDYDQLVMLEKSLAGEKHAVSLNRQMRVHRTALVSALYGLGFDATCYITAAHLPFQLRKINSRDFMLHCDWMFDPQHEEFKNAMIRGFNRVVDLHHDAVDITYGAVTEDDMTVIIDNARNFRENLRAIYTNTVVEIISGTVFAEPIDMFDEKFRNSVYAGNFPIMIGPVGAVELHRALGFDMFDDVVDHSYDTIHNPIERLQAAIVGNDRLLRDRDWAIEQWKQRSSRFLANHDHATNTLLDSMHRYNINHIEAHCV